jgi:arachidonate 15-lipoxygenase
MTTSLPQNDGDSDARAQALAVQQEVYRYSYTWPPGVAVAAEVPSADTYSLGYIARLLPVTWDLFRNTLGLTELVIDDGALRQKFEADMANVPAMESRHVGGWFLRAASVIADHVTATQPLSVESYGRFFDAISATPVWKVYDDDKAFAWQRIAGANPMVLSRLTALPDHLDADPDTFAPALAEGRLFACDYALLDGAPGGTTKGRKKYLPAPIALFEIVAGELVPRLIQVGQKRGSPVYTPAQAEGWRLAKLAVQVADANYHEAIFHLGRTHMVMEAVTLAMHRQLSTRHPLFVLLSPHTAFTLPINNSAATDLIAPGGVIDLAFGATIEATAGLVKTGLDGFSLRTTAVPRLELAARGLDDTSLLPIHPYRDDAIPVYDAIHRFVDGYVHLYYKTDADVAADPELMAFVAELGSQEGGRLRPLGTIDQIAELVTLIANAIWTASGQHSAVNFPQFPYMGAIPNMAGALWGPWPGAGIADDEKTHLDLLPPYNVGLAQFNTVYQLSNVRVSILGDYPFAHFLDLKVHGLLKQFTADLALVEAAINTREATRYLPYPHLLPSTIPASIHI